MSFHNTIITGSKGFIGHNLIKNLSHNIVPIENSKQSLNLPNIIDLNKQYNIICCGAYILKSNTSIYDPIKSIIDNILNSFISIYNIRYNISHICFLSTADVYKQPNEIPIIENHPIQPTTYYATS
ncbi:MAG: NAD-dependent epimerase/dehydratase family protein, partial [Methanogenium sp.]